MSALDWAAYAPFAAGVDRPFRDLPREAAEDHFARLMAARPARRAALEALWAHNAGDAPPRLDDAGPAAVGARLAAALGAAGRDALTGADAALWTGLVADVALWIGERVIAASGGRLRWELLTRRKKDTGYQRPVLVGFAGVADPDYYSDVAHIVASWAQLAARRRPNLKADFLAVVEDTLRRDATG